MSDQLQPKPLHDVGHIMAEYLGRDWCKDRDKIVRYINEMRELVYLEWPKLFNDRWYCINLETYCADCVQTCAHGGTTYKGFTIPIDIDGVLEVWMNHEPVKLRSRWYEGMTERFITGTRECLEGTIVGETFATERQMKCPGYLKMFSTHCDDDGKIAVVTVKDDCGTKEIHFELSHDTMVASDVLVFGIESVVLPNLRGCVSLFADDDELSCYAPHTTVPCFRRMKITKRCDVQQVYIHGSQKFQDVCFDTDIVEIGSRVILKEFSKVFRYGDMSTDKDEISKGMRAEQKVKALIRAAVERNRGNNHRDGNKFLNVDHLKPLSLYAKCGGGRRRRRIVN